MHSAGLHVLSYCLLYQHIRLICQILYLLFCYYSVNYVPLVYSVIRTAGVTMPCVIYCIGKRVPLSLFLSISRNTVNSPAMFRYSFLSKKLPAPAVDFGLHRYGKCF
jgi:hypothetical protein